MVTGLVARGRRVLAQAAFRHRGYIPIPFLGIAIFFAHPTILSLTVGFSMVLFGEFIRLWAVSAIGYESRSTRAPGGSRLVTCGPFAYVRNPLYLGNIFVYVGIGVMSMAFFPWLLLAAMGWFSFQYFLIVTEEEKYLFSRFGMEYGIYCARVPRFIPRLRAQRTLERAPGLSARAVLASERRTLQAELLVTFVFVAIYVAQDFRG